MKKDHDQFVATDQAAMHRATLEDAGAKPKGKVYIDVDRNHRYLVP